MSHKIDLAVGDTKFAMVTIQADDSESILKIVTQMGEMHNFNKIYYVSSDGEVIQKLSEAKSFNLLTDIADRLHDILDSIVTDTRINDSNMEEVVTMLTSVKHAVKKYNNLVNENQFHDIENIIMEVQRRIIERRNELTGNINKLYATEQRVKLSDKYPRTTP